ncbi:DUF192 domain-containing protein [Oculatella sp. LEGE 06141]|uniref:DUF192 domain-containing protein n=1 Tax=Oculatella sp. LEGE 06141 TaxID=1828648 RepID=UPI0018824395|nr:DUF192 domain-containing protein [Oculatella sp. LEGE 06141]MBE9180528.1 DUF192 domain-containing protein [Oculatella sp. LEGE 06141]
MAALLQHHILTDRRWLCCLNLGLSVLLLGCTSPTASSEAGSTVEPAPTPAQTEVAQTNQGQQLPIGAEAEIAGERIQLEVAGTPQQQAMGLMYRPPLPADRGMLFPVDPPRAVRFWMRNVPVPLDMVFIQDGEVKAIAASAPPCTTPTCPTYGPSEAVNQVIELRGGRAAELGLQVGDRITIRFLESALPPIQPAL